VWTNDFSQLGKKGAEEKCPASAPSMQQIKSMGCGNSMTPFLCLDKNPILAVKKQV